MNVMDFCDTLETPKRTKFILSNVVASKNNPQSTVFVFDVPENYISDEKTFESIIWTYTKGAALPACRMQLREEDGTFSDKIANKAVPLGWIQLMSLTKAFNSDVTYDDLKELAGMERDDLVDYFGLYVGRLVNTPMSGRVTGKDKKIRSQFKFPPFNYSDDPEENTESLEQLSDSFSPVEEDEQTAVQREHVANKNTVKTNATTPKGMEEGDEIIG